MSKETKDKKLENVEDSARTTASTRSASKNDKKKKPMSKKKKIIFTIVFLFVLIIIGSCIFGSDEEDDNSNGSIKILTEATDLDKEHATAVYNNFKSVGIEELTSCNFKSKKDGVKTYDFKCKKCAGLLKIKDKKAEQISSGYIYMYSSAGGAVRNINDYYIDDDKKFEILTRTEKAVKKCLKSPASAEFPDQAWDSGDWDITRYKNTVTIKSHVDSQNGFGAMIRSNFICQCSYDEEKLLYLKIDDEDVYGTFVEK